ncbi:MAG: HipA domain-containing protein [Proteobacteria bacterium]|nr:HipA domain-containing protein [Pseudomonadota bacterium]
MRKLNIYINADQVGVLSEEDDIWAFTYTPGWLGNPQRFPLSRHIALAEQKQTDGSTRRHIQWFFDNLLPEEGARDLLARDVKVAAADAFGLLEACGAESAGAITLLMPGKQLPAGSVEPLSREELSHRILRLPDVSLNADSAKRMSLAGAQHKMLLIEHKGDFLEPVGQMPSSHILKPEHSQPHLYWQTVRNEWFVMNLAAKLGLPVPKTTVSYVPEPVYIIERFDRAGRYPEQNRLPVLDGCQLLGLSRSDKYTQSDVTQLNDFSNIYRSKGLAKLSIFKWALFNALVGNGDAHLKNLSCFLGPRGFELAPFYDLLCTAIYEHKGTHLSAELSQPMGNAKTLEALSYTDILAFGQNLGLPEKLCEKETNKILAGIIPAADELYKQVQSSTDIQNIAGELRMLREIIELVIREMVSRMKPGI